MGIRQWLRTRLLERYEGRELPPGASLVVGKRAPTPHALGEYDAKTYPSSLAEQLRRREEVAEELVAMDVTTADARVASIPRLLELLRRYPHPLAYEMLLVAYVDAGRWEEARGVAFAARERRIECSYSPHPEVRAEISRLREWTDADIEALRQERMPPPPAAAPAEAAIAPRPATA